MKKTKVIINSVTIEDTDSLTNPKQVISWEYTKDEEAISDAEIVLLKSVNDLLNLNNGQVVEIYGGTSTSTDKRYFYGKIDSIKPTGSTITLLCKNEMIDLVRKNVNKVYDSSIDVSAGEISEIVEDLIETYGGLSATVQSSGTADGDRIDEFKCINTDIYERVLTLKKALDWDLFYDDNPRIVYFQPKGYTDSGITLNTKSEIIGLPDWDFDTSMMINDLRVDGATIDTTITETGQIGVTSGYTTSGITLNKTPNSAELLIDASNPPTTQREGGSKDASSSGYFYIDRENKKIVPATGTSFTSNHYAKINYIWSSPAPIHMINQASIDSYGQFQKTIQLSDVTSVADAESRASKYLAKRSLPLITAKINVKTQYTPNRGELVNIVDNITPNVNGLSVSGSYVVTSVTYKYPSGTEIIEVGDSAFRLDDWQQTTEERLKRLEEQFIRNQDIILELVDIQNQINLNPRYRQIISEEYDTLSGVSIWGLGTADGYYDWGDGKWGTTSDAFLDPVNVYMQQYQNIYTEEFIDTDFKSTNTTASWGSTGSVTFTSGQTAESNSIDYNNGTITSCKLTSTETSGSFEYFMNADGNISQFNTGTISGATYTTGTVDNYALSFNRTDPADYMVVTNMMDVNEGDYSFSCWVRIDNAQAGFESNAFADMRVGNSWSLYVDNLTPKFVYWHSLDSSTAYTMNSSVNITEGSWNNYLWTVTGDVWNLYLNGVNVGTSSGIGKFSNRSSSLYLGKAYSWNNTTNPLRALTGLVDEVRIYNRVLNSTEIETLYNKGDVSSSLIAKYSFEEGSGTKAYDTSNWERVVSGTLYTFQKTGTDLKWKAVENNASTGQISQIKLESYH